MFRKSLKYFGVAIVNAFILAMLLALWTDKLEMVFNDLVQPIEFLKIIGLSVVSLIGMRILVYVFRKRKIYLIRQKIKKAILITVLISSYLYVDYSLKIINNEIINRQIRKRVGEKIKLLASGSQADNLTSQEYEQISKMNWFPKLPKDATNISYIYEYDGFLPDYSFALKYELPIEMNVDTMNFEKGDFSRYQKFKIEGSKKIVSYNETER